MSDFTLVTGDCREVMRTMADCSVDAVVTDPPYGLRFMGKRWDYDVPSVDVFAEMYRVLKDGGRLLCFGGTRTFHRIWCNIEDAGFTIEDTIAWMYGSGFPKHKSKLKPAYEPICVARKGGVSELNINACRIGDDISRGNRYNGKAPGGGHTNIMSSAVSEVWNVPPGRWPANVVLDEEAARALDEMSGELGAGNHPAVRNTPSMFTANAQGQTDNARSTETGGASRFFYTAKASRSEREFGLEGMTRKRVARLNAMGDDPPEGIDPVSERFTTSPTANHHPCVKPVDLMCWLVRLVTQPGQTVLDPLMGSGTTGVAAIQEGRNFIGIELEEAYTEIARKRIGNAPLSLFAKPDGAA